MDVVGWDFESQLEELKSAFQFGGVGGCRRMMEIKRDEWKDIPLNVAVVGNSGVGKSSFINAIRRLTTDDEGAAAVGVKETTFAIQNNSHQNNPLLKFWDLPGVGVHHFPRKSYMSDIDVDRFDFTVLITADRFTENDAWLSSELRRRKKKCFIVRTKIGVDIRNNRKAHPRSHNEEDVVRAIRESTEQNLRECGCADVPVFLIDSYELQKFDFDRLERRLIEHFPQLKRFALILSLQATSKEVIRLKVAGLCSRMCKLAALSDGTAAIPVPGVSTVFDLSIVIQEAEFYFMQLGLDETSLKRFAKVTFTDYQQLQSTVDRSLSGLPRRRNRRIEETY